ncbi:nucleoside-diphosphate-sugar epimerase [Amycolatopsis echigonensis]|uniref:Nucleoside-diphosphate-sugar epimerase n=1 Tax=Amycolatopsis echigonensis TaxID=2576905 RepID=A0A2N3WUU0_9PSEU|nr:D-erythronate dehydrogenase [Amycolatopsis niigatensis]PKV97633.1 nucleoside-diphosphate-sugar epimerase [Amycolatopsis niigatensis]
MRIVITGGAGFIGSLVAGELLERGVFRGSEVTSLVLADRMPARVSDPRVEAVTGDLAEVVPRLFAEPVDVLIHLASAVSAEVEADTELGMRSNVDATRALLAACREQAAAGRVATFVFSSSVAVYGADPAAPLPSIVDETTLPAPQSSYGVQKLACEQFIADATRKGTVDGRIVRLMTVAVRPGRPNAAASSFLSSIVREPLNGEPAVCPVDPSLEVAIASPARTVNGLLAVAEAERGEGPGRLRGRIPVNLPALTVTVQDLLDALESVGGSDARALVEMRRDPAVEAIVGSWPARFDNRRAAELGLHADADALDVVRAFARDRAAAGR